MAKKKMTREEYYRAHGGSDISFNLVDKGTVERLVRLGDIKLPRKKIDIPKDMRWNTKWMNNELLAGIQNGESVTEIAKRIFPEIMSKSPTEGLTDKEMQGLLKRNAQAAIRNARTMTTGAECGGRLDSYKNLSTKGVVQEKVWIATPDSRTRESHLAIDGEARPIEQEFSNGLMFPADGNGEPAEVWNCRCSMRTHIIGFRRADGSISKVNYKRDKTMHDTQMDEERARRGVEKPVPVSTKTNSDYEAMMQKMLMQNYDNHVLANNLRLLTSDKIGADFFKVNFGNIDPEAAKAFTETMGKLMQEYDTPLASMRVMTKAEFERTFGSAFATTHHEYVGDTATMTINPVKFKDMEKVKERLQKLIGKGYAVNVPDELLEQYIATHEFAHTLLDFGTPFQKFLKDDFNIDINTLKKARAEIETIRQEYMEHIRELSANARINEKKFLESFDEEAAKKAREYYEELKKDTVSEYAHTNTDEFMAECFTLNRLNPNHNNKYAKEVGKIIDKYFKRKG